MTDFPNSITDISRRAGSYKRVELAITSVLSRWIDQIEEPAACAMIGAHAHTHAWHAQLWHERLPVLWDSDNTTFVVALDDDTVRALNNLSDDTTLNTTNVKLQALYREVIPALLQTYNAHLATVDAFIDPATARTLQLCINDLLDHIDEAHAVITSLSSTHS